MYYTECKNIVLVFSNFFFDIFLNYTKYPNKALLHCFFLCARVLMLINIKFYWKALLKSIGFPLAPCPWNNNLITYIAHHSPTGTSNINKLTDIASHLYCKIFWNGDKQTYLLPTFNQLLPGDPIFQCISQLISTGGSKPLTAAMFYHRLQ